MTYRSKRILFLACFIVLMLMAEGSSAQRRRMIKDPGGGAAPTILNEERYVGKYYQVNVGKGVEHHIFLGEERIATLKDAELIFPLSDQLGSHTTLTNNNGEVIEYLDYAPFGMEVFAQTTAGSRDDRRFLDKELDGETSLHYFGARYYDNGLARFNAVDPLLYDPTQMARIPIDPQQLNSYAYGRNNPFAFIDPTGEKVELVTRPVETVPVGSHAFVMITNSPEDAAKLVDVPGLQDKTKITFGGYIDGDFMTGDLVKQMNNDYDFTLPESRYVTRTEILKPEHYASQAEFENAVLRSFSNLPDRFGAYSPLGHPISREQANSNNVASTVLLNAGVDRSTVMSGLTPSQAILTPGIGSRPPERQAPSLRTQWRITKYLFNRVINHLSRVVR